MSAKSDHPAGLERGGKSEAKPESQVKRLGLGSGSARYETRQVKVIFVCLYYIKRLTYLFRAEWTVSLGKYSQD